MMYYTDNPDRDFDRWDADQQRKSERRPRCHACGEPIYDGFVLCSVDGERVYHPVECHAAWHDDVYKALSVPVLM